MLYTGKGDNGTTKTFKGEKRILKSSPITEALGSLDELNAFLGICKVHPEIDKFQLFQSDLHEEIHKVQEDLFIIQAQIAGAEKFIKQEKVKDMESVINWIESEMPKIQTFFISGGHDLSSNLDFARTLARRAERRIIEVSEKQLMKIEEVTLAYINRLSSLLYAFTRFVNHREGIEEKPPKYS